MTRWWEDPARKAEAVARVKATREQLGPRFGHTRELVQRPGDFYGTTAPRRKPHGGSRQHPTRDAL